MKRTIYTIRFVDNTTDKCSAPTEAPRHEVLKAYVRNNPDMVKAHMGTKGITREREYDTRDFE